MMHYIRLIGEFCISRAAKVVEWLAGSSEKPAGSSEKSLLESLPQELLIKVICGVDHDDLKSLVRVSKTIKEATLIAKKLYFDYTTPKKTLAVFGNSTDLEETREWRHHQEDNIESPPKAMRKEQLVSVARELFA